MLRSKYSIRIQDVLHIFKKCHVAFVLTCTVVTAAQHQLLLDWQLTCWCEMNRWLQHNTIIQCELRESAYIMTHMVTFPIGTGNVTNSALPDKAFHMLMLNPIM